MLSGVTPASASDGLATSSIQQCTMLTCGAPFDIALLTKLVLFHHDPQIDLKCSSADLASESKGIRDLERMVVQLIVAL